MKFKQIINSFSAWTVDRLTSARRATLTTLATFLIAMTAQTAWADNDPIGSIRYNSELGAYEINSWRNLWDLAVYVNGSGEYSVTIPNETTPHSCEGLTFIMTDDIEFNTTIDNNLTPVGDVNAKFKGTFDGQGHTISGVRIKQTGNQHIGIFGCVSGTVKNIVVSNCKIEGYARVSVIAAGLKSGTINNCHVVGNDVTLRGTDYVGGIVGESDEGTIEGCTCAATITGIINGGNADNMGGVVGKLNSSRLTNNIFTGAINGEFDTEIGCIGAIVGYPAGGSLSNNLYTSTGFGGIGKNGSTIGADGVGAKRAYTITGGEKVTVDFAGDATTYSPKGISVYAAGMKYDNTLYVDGTAAVNVLLSSDDPVNSYSASTGTLTGSANTGTNDAYTLTMTNPASNSTITADFALWDEKNGADGSAEKPYIISTTAGLDKLAQKVNGGIDTYNGKFFKLDANITYDPTVLTIDNDGDSNADSNYTPIGKLDKGFYGSFDGQGHTISGIKINNPDADFQGVFGNLKGKVNNLVVSNCSIVGRQNIGAIAGRFIKGINESDISGTIENCSVSNVTLKGINYIGGIAGTSEKGTIIGCASAATITGTGSGGHQAKWLGGIVGATSDNSVLTNNLFTGTISDNREDYIGAIVGVNGSATLTNNLYTSAGLGGIGAASSKTGADGAGAHKAVEIIAAEGVTITPTGTKTTYNVSGITAYTDNNFIGYDSKLYAGATTRAKLSITYTVPEGYIFDGIDAGEGVGIVLNEGVYNLAVPASGNVTISAKLKNLTMTLDKIVEFETLAIDENMQSYVENGALKLKVTPKNKFWTLACGVDLLLPEGIVVYKARMNSAGTKVDLTEISDSELNGVLKANNGVLIASTPGESYEFKVSPENSVTTLSTADAKSYGNDNQLVPVLEETHFDSENYFILTDNQFVMVDVSQDTKVPAGKAVLKVPAGTAQARAFGIDANDTTGDTTGINAALENAGEEVWYNLQGQRISKPTRKGIYILNGKKVRM